MNKRFLELSAVAASLLLITACSHFDPNNGVRVNHNTAQQAVDPYAGFDDEVATLDGQKAEKQLEEYRSEKSKAPSEQLLQGIGSQ